MTHSTRRTFLGMLAALAGGRAAAQTLVADTASMPKVVPFKPGAKAFSVDALKAEARALAMNPYRPRPLIPQEWRDLSYDMFRSIWFRSDHAVWNGTDIGFRADLLHPGLYFPQGVTVSLVEGDIAHELAFDISAFDHTDKFPDLPIDDTLGYSGVRLRGILPQVGINQEFAVFQGASYFRAVGRDEVYGLSSRGLALRTADAEGEEFPDFTKFWLEVPDAQSATLRMHALLDSPSTTGAYTFEIAPGEATVIDVSATIFPRVDLLHVGVGPLTSMFLFDATNRNRFDDFRPAVHDSNGLLVANGAGEWLWRALANPVHLQVSSFVDENPKGFGLVQRSRSFSDFADLEANYHRRPSVWIEPGQGWGKGSVTLVEIPADKEIYDNIVAYWRPRDPMPAGSEFPFAYRMTWAQNIRTSDGVAQILKTRLGGRVEGGHVVTVDYAPHPSIPLDIATVTIRLSTSAGSVTPGILQRNPDTGGPRLAFTFDPGDAAVAELRAALVVDGIAISEVWLYRWTT